MPIGWWPTDRQTTRTDGPLCGGAQSCARREHQQVAYAAAGFRQASIRANSIVHRAERIVAMAPKRSTAPHGETSDPGVRSDDDTNADQQQRSVIRSAHANVPDDQFDALLARAAETGAQAVLRQNAL